MLFPRIKNLPFLLTEKSAIAMWFLSCLRIVKWNLITWAYLFGVRYRARGLNSNTFSRQEQPFPAFPKKQSACFGSANPSEDMRKILLKLTPMKPRDYFFAKLQLCNLPQATGCIEECTNRTVKVAEHSFSTRSCWCNLARAQGFQNTNMPSTERSFYLLKTRPICVIFLYNCMQCIDGFSILLQRYVIKGNDAKYTAIFSFCLLQKEPS